MKETSGRLDVGVGVGVDLDVGLFVPTQSDDAVPEAARELPTATRTRTASSARAGAGSWVESSWELRRGLVVSEGLPVDAGLDEWLEATLRR